MKKRGSGKIRGFVIAAAAVCFLAWPLSGTAAAGETDLVIVDDGAGLLPEETERELQNQARELSEDTGYQFMLVTAEDAQGKEAREYAEDYYMDHQITLDGVIYLIDMDNREIYIATSGQMRYYLTDSRVDHLLDQAFDAVSEGEYGDAFQEMLSGTGEYLDRGIPDGTYLVDEDTGEVQVYRKPRGITPLEAAAAVIAGVVCAGALFAGVSARYRMKGRRDSYRSQEQSSLHLTGSQDRFVNQFVTHRHIPKNPPPGGHGGGGGHSSTVHTGSGGNSFGGGGRKF